MSQESEPRRSRREEYAEQTRRDVVDAARTLFAKRGYFSTTVNDIAELGRVSAGTVYQQCGGKQGLLQTLLDMWTTDPLIAESMSAVDEATTLDEGLRILTDAYLLMYQLFDDIAQVVFVTALHDDDAAASLEAANARQRTALHYFAQKVFELGDFSKSFTPDDFADLAMYFYGAQSGFHFTVSVLGWPVERAKKWLFEQFTRSLSAVASSPL
ncbi:TetR/AcrR family transcriptional regulator [Mycolicibacterium komossense]|uniref:TetR/AcrR family transcriptional regulator n=1 Tax=Mycolicibacterium komossense TaxID=1779 RepID=A0ABT3CK59_9MYCO|nr:TetR/AcrR family transcriptional regulator [Mycolicibacterium komossense]MCV7229825.1 TetR/AcrR family transcriptional regulator [Mycolicibacterium komossense]